jgi:quercetin dioxygenase-like cupin family protein
MSSETRAARTTEPVIVRRGDGEARWWFGSLVEFKATARDTGGQVTIVEVTEAPAAEAPLHVHHRDDEAFWILEGDATFYVGDTTIEARDGDYVWAPRDIPHRFTVGERGCRMLFILVPAGIEAVITETSEPAAARTLPPPEDEAPDAAEIDHLKAIVAEHGYELLV